MDALVDRIRAGETRATARACRMVDDRAEGYAELLRALAGSGRAWTLGVTGAPGAGKSTLVDVLVAELRLRGQRVGVIAVDPTSPFSGGAILGDRIRMQRHFEDEDVFIRSLATRGALGGLSRSAADVASVLAAWGADVVLLETVGVGQDELEVAAVTDTTLVVAAPGLGDDVQAIKAGVLEVADVFAVNKADRDGADAAVADLQTMLALGERLVAPRTGSHSGLRSSTVSESPALHTWEVPIVRTVASRAEGVKELLEKLCDHQRWLDGTRAGRAQRVSQRRRGLEMRLRDELGAALVARLDHRIEAVALDVAAGQMDIITATETLLEELGIR